MAEEGLLGGLLRGIAQGMQINQRRRRDDEELKLKKKLADAQIELDQIRIGKEQEASVERAARRGREQSLRDLILEETAPGTVEVPRSPFAERPAGDEPLGQTLDLPQSAITGRQQATRSAKLRSLLIGQVPESQLGATVGVEPPMSPLIRAILERQLGQLAPEALSQSGTPPPGQTEPVTGPLVAPAAPPAAAPDVGITLTPGRQPTVRLNPPRQPMGAENDVYQRTLRETGSVEKAQKARDAFRRSGAAAGGAGTESGRLGVRSSPEFQQTESDIARRRGAGQRQAPMEAPLTPAEAGTLGVPFGTTGEQARGLTALTSAARNTLTNMSSAEAVLTIMEKTLTGPNATIPTPSGAMERAAQTPGRVLSGLTQTDPAVVNYHSLAKGMLAAFSRSIGGERGQTTEADVARAEELIPKVFPVPDTKAVAEGKLKQLRGLIQEIKERTRTSASAPGVQPGRQAAPKGAAPPSTAEDYIKSLVGQ